MLIIHFHKSDRINIIESIARNVTDIPYYERVEYSHLHDFGQKSERTRFLEKIKKLEEAADVKAKLGTVEEVHRPVEKPPGWKPVKLPKRIERGQSDFNFFAYVLREICGLVSPGQGCQGIRLVSLVRVVSASD